MDEAKVDTSLKKGKVQDFLDNLMKLCSKHNITICDTGVKFHGWELFTSLDADEETASLYWPRIQTDIVVRKKHD